MAYTFQQCYAYGHSKVAMRLARIVVRRKFPQLMSVQPSTRHEDRKGVDLWVHLRDGQRIAIDVKTQRNYPGWLPLETWSNVEKHIKGWTLREDYVTDQVLWIWPQFKRFALVPFKPLQDAFRAHGKEWYNTFPVSRQYTPPCNPLSKEGYHSEIVLVPFNVIQQSMGDLNQIALRFS